MEQPREEGQGMPQGHQDNEASTLPPPAAGSNPTNEFGGSPQDAREIEASAAAAQAMEEIARMPHQHAYAHGTNSNDGRSTGEDSGQRHGDYGGSQGGDPNDPAARRRTPRQQEQNKHAQQRYRARRKAQFEELQDTVATLRTQLKQYERDAQQRQDLEVEVLRLRAAAAAGGPPPPPTALPSGLPGMAGPPSAPGGRQGGPPLHTLLQALGTQGVGPFAPPPRPSVPGNADVSPAQIQAMMVALGQELWSFVSSPGVQKLGGPEPAPQVLVVQMSQLIKMGLELIGLILGVSGPDAELILHDNNPPELPCAADHPRRWRAVAGNVALSPAQAARVVAWRDTFLAQLDTCYSARVTLKLKTTQTMKSAPGEAPQWAEDLLLRAAGGAGYTLSAQAAAELSEAVSGLQRNVSEERAIVVNAMSELLLNVLTPVQAVRYLATSHPFSWNGLAFGSLVVGDNSRGGLGGPRPGPGGPGPS